MRDNSKLSVGFCDGKNIDNPLLSVNWDRGWNGTDNQVLSIRNKYDDLQIVHNYRGLLDYLLLSVGFG